MNTSFKRWLIAGLYVGFIYATLNIAWIPTQYLRVHGVLRISLFVFYAVCFVVLLRWLIQSGARELWRLGVLFVIFLLMWWISFNMKRIEEILHFFEYGLVGVFFSRALETKWPIGKRVFALSILLAGLCGWLDEIFQGLLPNRHYELHDIILNVLSAASGLVLYSLFPRNSLAPQSASTARSLNSSVQS